MSWHTNGAHARRPRRVRSNAVQARQHRANAAAAMAIQAESGPNPLDARLVLRLAGGKRTKSIWYVLQNGKYTSTRLQEDDRAAAEIFLSNHVRKKSSVDTCAMTDGGFLTWADVLREHKEEVEKAARLPHEKRTARKIKNHVTTATRFWGERRVADYENVHSGDFANWYLDEREDWKKSHPGTPEKNHLTTAIELCKLLNQAAERYEGRHPGIVIPVVELPKKGKLPPRRWLRPEEYGALLCACLGYRRDPQTGEWMTRTFVDGEGHVRTTRRVADRATVANRKPLSRLIRLGVQTGSRHEVMLSTVWGGPRPMSASIECDENGRGKYHRRGENEIDTIKARPTSPIRAELRFWIRIWGKEDGHFRCEGSPGVKKHKYLIRKRTGGHYLSSLWSPFKTLVRDAGLGSDVTIHVLKHTAVNWCHQRGFSIEFTAKMLGTKAETLRRHYTDWHSEQSDEAALAEFDDPSNLASWRDVRKRPQYQEEADDRVRERDKPFKEPRESDAHAAA